MVASSDALAPNGTHFAMAANGNGSGGLMDAEVQPEASAPPTTLEPIAICGLGLRLPGGIRNGDDFWDLLINGRDARGETPSTRFATEGFAAASTSGNGTVPTRYGYYLEDDLARLDTSFFSMSKTELEWCDPQQRLLLEVVRECLDDAGETNYRGQAVGCYVGTFGQDWYEMTMRDFQSIGGYTMMGCADLVLANRVAYEFDLRGPSMVIKTGCSASMEALHEACRALQAGDASAAVVGGTSLILSPTTTALLANEGVLSPDASCKTFDVAADGFARAEGITAIYIKRLSDAIRDGNPIRAVIRGTASNSDGRGKGLMNPSAEAHEALMRQVYRQAGLDPGETAFVECHGTGTATGDPIETRAVGNVFGDKGVYIGSVKPNVGHSEGCSGITSVIKAVLALEHHTIPPNIKFANPNPKIPFAEKKLLVPVKATPFPSGRAERISVNSFGIGGSNAHAILESPRSARAAIINGTNGVTKSQTPQLFLFSANTTVSLNSQMDCFKDYTVQHPDQIRDVAHTLALRREHLPQRTFAVVKDGEFVETPMPAKASGNEPSLTMIFSGQGAQWPGMGRELIMNNASFREDIIHMDNVLQGLRVPPRWSLLGELLKFEEASQVHRAELAQPLSTALQLALVRQFRKVGVTPSSVVGHSSGEIAAAYTAGYISLEYAITLAYYRGYVATYGMAVQSGGMMAAVGLGAADVARFLQPGSSVACENSPSSTTISGDVKAVQNALAAIQLEHPGILARPLKVDVAYHSYHMAALAAEYVGLLHAETSVVPSPSKPNPRSTLFISSVTSTPILDAAGLATPYYWAINLVSPVQFSSAVTTLLTHHLPANTPTVLLEIGPHAALAGPLRQIATTASHPHTYIPSQTRHKNSSVAFLAALGRLFQESAPVDWSALFPGAKTLPGLPPYPWDHSAGPFWHESRLSQAWRLRRYANHPLLGSRVVETPDTAPQWRAVVGCEQVGWLTEHKVRGDVVFPFAGYVAMAGEAARQITGGSGGWKMRRVVVKTALVVGETEAVEVVTSLRQVRLSDEEVSAWWEFAIASWTGSAWVRHCEGQVMAVAEGRKGEAKGEVLPRKVAKTRFYDAMARAGVLFGPQFQRLTDISASVKERTAHATVVCPGDSAFPGPVHPATIDACIQLLLVADVKGLCRDLHQLVVPTRIEHIEVSQGTDEMHAHATFSAPGHASSNVECLTPEGRVAVRLSGLQVTPLGNDADDSPRSPSDIHAAARLHWLPDFDFTPATSLIIPPIVPRTERELHEELTLLCILDSADTLPSFTPSNPHFAKYLSWLALQTTLAQSGAYPPVPHASTLAALTPSDRKAKIDSTLSQILSLPGGGSHAAALGTARIHTHAAALFTGERDTLDLMMQDDLLTGIYSEDPFEYGALVRSLAHSRPGLRILEVGGGTGGTTERILRYLEEVGGEEGGMPAYKEYMFTDVSAGFFPQARERFAYARNLEFKELDASREAVAQGFEKGAYDLVVATNVVHATPCLRETLGNLRGLLKPEGMLLLTEISTVSRMPGYIFGNFSGWWLGEKDGREWEPHVLPERWDEELKAAGYMGAETVVSDEEMPYQMTVAILSRPRVEEVVEDKAVTVLCQTPEDGPAASLIAGLRGEGLEVTPCRLGTEFPPRGSDIIACVDLETRYFDQDTLTEEQFLAFQALLRHLRTSENHILWLTPPYQVKCKNPHGAQSLGVMRAARAEMGLSLVTLELDYEAEGSNAAHLIASVFNKKVRGAQPDTFLNADREFAVDNGTILSGRYHPFSLTSEQASPATTTALTTAPTAKSITIPNPGTLSSLSWLSHPLPTTLSPTAIEITVHASALNFHDLLLAAGTMAPPPPPSTPSISPTPTPIILGLEAAGTITRAGAAVPNLRPGDHVMFFTPPDTTSLTTRLVVDARTTPIVRVPAGMTLSAAAGTPVAFATALYGLLDAGRLRKGMTVLIHSACGGVGLAALQVCRAVLGGLDGVYVTVGSEEKVAYLVEKWGIGRERVFGSRDAGFVEGVMRETRGRGVDVVLNSLSGELLHSSWGCVAPYGTMVEMGNRDLAGGGKLDLAPFLGNRGYVGVELHRLLCERPERVQELLVQYIDMYSQGLLHQPDEVSYFEAQEVERAFRHLQNGAHIGKVVVTIPSDDSVIKAVPYNKPLTLDPEATYLLVGGAKGLGASIATRLVEQGAMHLTILSRAAGVSAESKALFEELEAMGCELSIVSGSVESMEDVEAAVNSSGKPVKGVFQLAMVLNDAPLLDMKWTEWNTAVGPKVRGTWNLHHALTNQPLDFFWMASSLVTVIDEPGQGNYSAGCAFLETFCQYRHSLGLPATVLNICPVEGVGYVAESAQARWNMKAQGLYSLGEHEFLDFVTLNLLQPGPNKPEASDPLTTPWENRGQVLMGLRSGCEQHLDDPNNRTSWRRDRRMGRYHNLRLEDGAKGAASDTSPLAQFLERVHSAGADTEAAIQLLTDTDNVAFLAGEIGRKVFELMLKPLEEGVEVDTRQTLGQIGLDSLMAIELRRWVRRVFGVSVSVLEIMGSGALIEVGQLVTGKLVDKMQK